MAELQTGVHNGLSVEQLSLMQDVVNHFKTVQELVTMVNGDVAMANRVMEGAKQNLSEAVYNCEDGEECGEHNRRLFERPLGDMESQKAALAFSSQDLRRQIYGLLKQNKAFLSDLDAMAME